MKPVPVSQSRTVKTKLIFPPDTNHLGTMFGGKVLSYIDEVAAMAAMRHSGKRVVTASMDSIDFIAPVKEGDAIVVEGFVTWSGRSSMEVFARVIAENLIIGQKVVTATSFLTMVAVDEQGKPIPVPAVLAETEEKMLHRTAPERQRRRKERRKLFSTADGATF